MKKSKKKIHGCESCNIGGESYIVAIIFLLIGIIIISFFCLMFKYSKKKKISGNGVLEKILLSNLETGSNFWELSHFVLFALVGFFFPCCDGVAISIGIAWELIEQFLGLTLDPITITKSNGQKTTIQWWYGSPIDIFIDITGFYVGKSFRLLLSDEQNITMKKIFYFNYLNNRE